MKKADRAVLKKWVKMSAIIFAIAYSLNCFVVSKLTIIISNNVIFSDTVVPQLIEYLGEMIELGAISFCYAVLLLVIYKWETQGVRKVFATFIVATFLKYFANIILGWIDEGSVPLLWLVDITYVLVYTMIEFVQFIIVYRLCSKIINKFTEERNFMKRIADKGGPADVEVQAHAYLFDRVFDKKNCLLRSAYICAIVTLIAKLGGTVLSDLLIIIDGGMSEQLMAWLLLLLTYISKFIFGFMCYLFVYYSMSVISRNLEK